MLIRLGYEIAIECPQPTPLVSMLEIREEHQPDIRRRTRVLTSPAERPHGRTRVSPLRRRPPVRDALTTLRANLTLQSTACRHALRLAVVMALGTSVYRLLGLPR